MRVFTLRIMRESLHSHASQIGSPDKVCINSLPPDLPKCGHKEYALTKGREDGIFFPFACTRNRARAGSMKSAPIPRDLVELLGPDAAAQLWDEYGGTGYEAPEWWSLGVPNLIKLLRHELAEKEMWLADERSAEDLTYQQFSVGPTQCDVFSATKADTRTTHMSM